METYPLGAKGHKTLSFSILKVEDLRRVCIITMTIIALDSIE
ncbi:MAG: hypothetical protein AAFO84_12530 [Cyanobacteria bacterium J06598_1]